jgi:glycine cleavage system H protein
MYMEYPEDLYYTHEHEWLKIDDQNKKIAYIGVTDFAQRELGDIVYVEVDNFDDEVEQNEPFGSIEAVKTVTDMFMPVTGKILEINEDLEQCPELLNSDPYEDGWIIKMTNSKELESLLSVDDYKEIIGYVD